MKKIILFLITVFTVQIFNAQEPRIYYIDYIETINTVSLSGTDDEVILTSFNNPQGISFYNDKLYVSDDNLVNRNYSFNPDGTSGKIVHDETDGAIKPSSVSGYNNELYFIDRDFIRKSDINGDNIVNVFPTPSSSRAKVVVSDNKIYYNALSALWAINNDGTETLISDNGNTFRGFWVQGDFIYYIVDGAIKKSVIDGSNEMVIIPASSANISIPIDLTIFENKLYYTDTGLDKIMRSNLDGSNVEEVYNIPGAIPNPRGIAGHNGYIYWADSNNDTVSRITTNLTDFEVIIGGDFSSVRSLTASNNELYFTDDYIKKSNLSGDMVSTLSASTNLIYETELSVDGDLFYTDLTTGIYKTPTNSFNPQTIISPQTTGFIDSFDIVGDFIYWIENENNIGKVYSAFIDGSNIQNIFTDTVQLSSIEFDDNKLYWIKNSGSLVSSDTSGLNQQAFHNANGSISDFAIFSGKAYFGLSRPDFTYALCRKDVTGFNFLVLKELTTSIDDIKIYESENNTHPDYDALVALYNSTNGANWTTTWDLNADISTFHGVSLDASNRVSAIVLNNNNLTGTLPAELGDLTNLRSLFLSGNQLIGEIPSQVGNLTNLDSMSLNFNDLTGSIPVEIANMSSLSRLFLNDNILTGTIPAQLENLTNLTELFLSNNQLSGTIPPELGNISNLDLLYLQDNSLTGSIPIQLANLTTLSDLFLRNNQLTGTIPGELGNLLNLFRLDLSGNQLSGDIPSDLGNLSGLAFLGLSNNQLTGTIPSQLGNLFGLDFLRLDNNNLTGTIPLQLGNITNLFELNLSNNQLIGEIPNVLGNLTGLAVFLINNNQFSGEIPSGLSTINNLVIDISNNNFAFKDFEDDFASYQSLTGFTYAPQNKFDNEESALVDLGGSITFTSRFANLDGNTPASINNTYQWFKNDIAIVNATGPSLEITNATLDDVGFYTLKVNNTTVSDLELERNLIALEVNTFLEANYFLVTDNTIVKGNSDNIDIQLVNSQDVRGFQFDITLPTGFVFNTMDLISSARLSEFEVSVSDLGNNTFRILGFSFSNGIITPGDGAILSLPTLVEATTMAGDYSLDISNVVISGPNNQDITTAADAIGTIVVLDFALGDSNGNGNVDVLDLLQTIDFILGNNPMPFAFDASDVNMDGIINILDVVGIQDIILNPGTNAQENQIDVLASRSTNMSNNYLLVTDQSVMQGDSANIEIELENEDIIRAIQFDINVPAGFTLNTAGISAVGRLSGFNVSSSDLGGNTFRILAFSFSGGTMAAGTDAILNLPITIDPTAALGDYTLDMTGVILSDQSNMDVASAPLSVGTVTVSDTLGVNEDDLNESFVNMYPNPANSFVNLNINSNYKGHIHISIYDIAGKRVHNSQVEKTQAYLTTRINTSQLSDGVYILKIKTQNNSITKRVIISQ